MYKVFSFQSTILNQTRTIRMYTPKNYLNTNKRLPVLYMHDGQNIFRDEDAIGGVSLSFEKAFDDHDCQMIVVGIDSIQTQRIEDYSPWQRGEYSQQFHIDDSCQPDGQRYIDFVTNELKSFIDKHYRTNPDNTAIAGISLGGLISAYAVCAYPTIYKSMAVFSSSFYRNQEKIEDLIRNSDISHVNKIYIDCGSLESDDNKVNHAFIHSNDEVAKAFQTELTIINGAKHDYSHFRHRVSKILINWFSKKG
ncbi:alpha/beta hydrolase-fold protein [Cytobacillus sp. FSL W7-1323]|uniref:alpha/beta hydrolase n=1 Tax=Cytobacillus sp. FSL W7-1323 TaxID=2921700 RepID=UPI0031595A03